MTRAPTAPLRPDRSRSAVSMRSLQRFWHQNSPQLFLSELLEKRWMEPIIPFTLTIAVFLAFALTIPRYLSAGSLQELMLNFAEQGMVAIAMAFSVLSGGIDLSVGSDLRDGEFYCALFLSHSWLAAARDDRSRPRFRRVDGSGQRRVDRLREDPSFSDDARRPHHLARRLQQGDGRFHRPTGEHQQRLVGLGLHRWRQDSRPPDRIWLG